MILNEFNFGLLYCLGSLCVFFFQLWPFIDNGYSLVRNVLLISTDVPQERLWPGRLP